MIRAVLQALALALCPLAVAAADWQGFYTPTERQSARGADENSACLREILLAQQRYDIPRNLLLGIGLQEAGISRGGSFTVWPWTANSEGEGRFFDSAADAAAWVRGQQASGIASIDVGCMQINLRWHPEAFASLEDGLNPALNVDYAARMLKGLYRRTGDWATAAASYHSFTPDLQDAYLQRLAHNLDVANLRIEEFRALAARSGPVSREAPVETGGIFWSAWLGRDAGAVPGGRSLFGTGRIEPILPAFHSFPKASG
jgi:hypothetical protein